MDSATHYDIKTTVMNSTLRLWLVFGMALACWCMPVASKADYLEKLMSGEATILIDNFSHRDGIPDSIAEMLRERMIINLEACGLRTIKRAAERILPCHHGNTVRLDSIRHKLRDSIMNDTIEKDFLLTGHISSFSITKQTSDSCCAYAPISNMNLEQEI